MPLGITKLTTEHFLMLCTQFM